MEYLLTEELNEKVSTDVLGYTKKFHKLAGCHYWEGHPLNVWSINFLPAERMSDAWTVIEHLERGHDIQLTCEGGWYIVDVRAGDQFFRGEANNMPRAICLVALKAFA